MTSTVTLFLALIPSLEEKNQNMQARRYRKGSCNKFSCFMTYLEVLKEADFHNLRSMMMYIIIMNITGNAKDVMKKLIWKALKL